MTRSKFSLSKSYKQRNGSLLFTVDLHDLYCIIHVKYGLVTKYKFAFLYTYACCFV